MRIDSTPMSAIRLKRCKFCGREKVKEGWYWCKIQEEKNKTREFHFNSCTELNSKLCPISLNKKKEDSK